MSACVVCLLCRCRPSASPRIRHGAFLFINSAWKMWTRPHLDFPASHPSVCRKTERRKMIQPHYVIVNSFQIQRSDHYRSQLTLVLWLILQVVDVNTLHERQRRELKNVSLFAFRFFLSFHISFNDISHCSAVLSRTIYENHEWIGK